MFTVLCLIVASIQCIESVTCGHETAYTTASTAPDVEDDCNPKPTPAYVAPVEPAYVEPAYVEPAYAVPEYEDETTEAYEDETTTYVAADQPTYMEADQSPEEDEYVIAGTEPCPEDGYAIAGTEPCPEDGYAIAGATGEPDDGLPTEGSNVGVFKGGAPGLINEGDNDSDSENGELLSNDDSSSSSLSASITAVLVAGSMVFFF